MAAVNSSNNKNSSAPRVSADMARARNKFLPSIFEEKNDEKIQDFRKALKISEDDEEEQETNNLVRSAIHEEESADENKASMAAKDPSVPRRAGTASWSRLKPLVRSLSESRMDQWRSKRQGSAFAGGSRINSGIASGQRSFGIGQRKITSPGVNRARVEVAEVIDLTNPEEVKQIARRFFQDELKMDLLDPRFDRPDDFLASLRWKAERKFSYGELWQRRMSGGYNGHATLANSSTINQRLNTNKLEQINKYSQVQPYTPIDSPFFQVSYSKPKALKTSNGNSFAEKKTLTTSFKQQADYGSRQKRGRILNPLRREVKTSKNSLRRCRQTQEEKKN
ncbi:uncharacterized protein LOC144664910 [Oculina patagonica]